MIHRRTISMAAIIQLVVLFQLTIETFSDLPPVKKKFIINKYQEKYEDSGAQLTQETRKPIENDALKPDKDTLTRVKKYIREEEKPKKFTIKKVVYSVFLCKETVTDYLARMRLNGFPCVGDTNYAYYKHLMDAYHKKKYLNTKEYEIFMDSIPRIYENRNSVNQRIKLNNLYLSKEVKEYPSERFDCLMDLHYPKLYETFVEHEQRIYHLGGVGFSEPIFKRLKQFCPTFGEVYDQYNERLKQFGLPAFSEDDFDTFIELFPKPGESCENYLNRCNANRDQAESNYIWAEMTENDFNGLNQLVPKFKETYETYKNRLIKFGIIPIPEDIFVIYSNGGTPIKNHKKKELKSEISINTDGKPYFLDTLVIKNKTFITECFKKKELI